MTFSFAFTCRFRVRQSVLGCTPVSVCDRVCEPGPQGARGLTILSPWCPIPILPCPVSRQVLQAEPCTSPAQAALSPLIMSYRPALHGNQTRVCAGKELLKVTWSKPCKEQGHLTLDQVSQSPVQPDLGCLQGWGIHHQSGHPVPVLHHQPRSPVPPRSSQVLCLSSESQSPPQSSAALSQHVIASVMQHPALDLQENCISSITIAHSP